MIKQAKRIMIVSGEGVGPGTAEEFHGRKTWRAIHRRLRKERCNGDRWAEAYLLIDGLWVTETGEPVGLEGDIFEEVQNEQH